MARGKFEGRWMRSDKHDRCIGCKSAERPHYTLGMCQRCYQQSDYYKNHARELKAKKRYRLKVSDEIAGRNLAAKRKWNRTAKGRRWYREYAKGKSPYQIGRVCWIEHGGEIRRAIIKARPNKGVLLKLYGGGQILLTCLRDLPNRLMFEPPPKQPFVPTPIMEDEPTWRIYLCPETLETLRAAPQPMSETKGRDPIRKLLRFAFGLENDAH